MRLARFSACGDGNGGVCGGHDVEDVQSQLAVAVVRPQHEEVGGEGDGGGQQGVEEPQQRLQVRGGGCDGGVGDDAVVKAWFQNLVRVE